MVYRRYSGVSIRNFEGRCHMVMDTYTGRRGLHLQIMNAMYYSHAVLV